jgi:twinkle protein
MTDRVKNRPCPACRENNHDRTGDHLFCMQDGITWACYRTQHHSNGQPYIEKQDGSEKTTVIPKNTKIQFEDVKDLAFSPEHIRGIDKDILEKYKVKVEFDEESGEIVKHYYPMISKEKGNGYKTLAYKVRVVADKFFFTIGKAKEAKGFFGMDTVCKFDTLLITEGELDAMAAHQMLMIWGVNVVSINKGSETIDPFIDNKEWLNKFSKIVIAPDMDEAGDRCTTEIAKLFPQVHVMEYSEKDANAMLMEQKEKEFADAFLNAQVYRPKCVVAPSAVAHEAVQPIKWGLTYPFDKLTEITYGARTGRSIGIGAGPGTGKTTFINQIAAHLAYEHKETIGYFGLEYSPSYSLRQFVATVMNKPIHLPDCEYDVDEAQKIADELQGKILFYDIGHYDSKWSSIEDPIRYFNSQGMNYFLIDPVSGLTAGMKDSEINAFLNHAMFQISKLTRELGITIFHVSHLNNPTSGKSHDEGGRITGAQWSGSRAQWRYSTELWGLERNQQAENEEDRNTVTVRVIKDRLSGLTGTFDLKYNREKGILEEKSAFNPVG